MEHFDNTTTHRAAEETAPDPRLYDAVTRDDHMEIIRLVTSGSSPNATDPHFGVPAAYWAADLGHALSLQILLSLGADRDCVGFDGERPLHSAARRGDLACTAVLLISRADTRALNRRLEQPLHLSSAGGNLAVSYLLLACGADTAAADERGLTPAGRAEEYGYTLLELLFTCFKALTVWADGSDLLSQSLAFGQLRSRLKAFGLDGDPQADSRRLHPLTKLRVPVERPQPTTIPQAAGLAVRSSIADAGTELMM
ncbi:MAG: ankyrin repeat domain-containing protein [Pyrinomonadaceae bacterium]